MNTLSAPQVVEFAFLVIAASFIAGATGISWKKKDRVFTLIGIMFWIMAMVSFLPITDLFVDKKMQFASYIANIVLSVCFFVIGRAWN